MKGVCRVLVMEHSAGVVQKCRVCGAILSTGRFLIGLHVREDEKDFRYFLGAPPQMHCGELKKLLLCFTAEDVAEVERLKTLSYVSEKGTTEGLPLMGFFDPSSN